MAFKNSPCTIRRADCDIDHYLLVTNVRQKLSASKQTAQALYVERFNLKKLSELEVRKLRPQRGLQLCRPEMIART